MTPWTDRDAIRNAEQQESARRLIDGPTPYVPSPGPASHRTSYLLVALLFLALAVIVPAVTVWHAAIEMQRSMK